MTIMKILSLNGNWHMQRGDGTNKIPASVPGTVYSDLLRAGKMEDPYYRDNEDSARDLLDYEYIYSREFDVPEEYVSLNAILHCEGLDTLADIVINGIKVAFVNNMHRTWEFCINDYINAGTNSITIKFYSPTRYIKEENAKIPLRGSAHCSAGFAHLRKAHYMLGWDWGPRLPDAGIWRNIEIRFSRGNVLRSVLVIQDHKEGQVTLNFIPEIQHYSSVGLEETIVYRVIDPNGKEIKVDGDRCVIGNPMLWWPNGYGDHPLYTVIAEYSDKYGIINSWSRKIGLRTIKIDTSKDQWGEAFKIVVNGLPIFCMGANYIPEDNILTRVTRERTYNLISDCALAGFNTIRVWGGGYYQDDWFYDACDEKGIIVWQDLMFASASYRLTDESWDNISAEIADNVRRLRHHACLGLWCGNNEIEMQDDVLLDVPQYKTEYLCMFEYLIPKEIRKYDPVTPYRPSSPSAAGSFDDCNADNRGDQHYWEVWHDDKPFPEYRKHLFRFVSEFGFQSFPCLKTIESFTEIEDRNPFSYVMEKHQRNQSANGKILNYLSQTFLYPTSFDLILYASQLLQMEAIRYGAEHWRRNRGRCMGAIYWQVNDCWPVASWSSIDYYGRWKALHYAAKRFFAPILISCEEEGTLSQETNVNAEYYKDIKMTAKLNVSNETNKEINAVVYWKLCSPLSEVVLKGEFNAKVPAFTAVWFDKLDFTEYDFRDKYLSFELYNGDEFISSGSTLFCAPKHFKFADPNLSIQVHDNIITVHSDAYAHCVEILCDDGDVLLSDNYFNMNRGSVSVKILRGTGTNFRVRSVFDIK
jgi:beta-mannosidase